MACIIARCGRRTPLGRPVVPLVNRSRNGSSPPCTRTSSSSSAAESSGAASASKICREEEGRTPAGSALGSIATSVTTAERPASASCAATGASFAHCASVDAITTLGRTRSAMLAACSAPSCAKSAAGSTRSACAASENACQPGSFSERIRIRSPGPSRSPARNAAARRTRRSKPAKVIARGGASGARGSTTRRKTASGLRRALATSAWGSVAGPKGSVPGMGMGILPGFRPGEDPLNA